MKKFYIIIIAIILLLPLTGLAKNCSATPDPATPNELCNPITVASDLPSFGIRLLQVFASAAGVTAIIFVLFSGFRFITSQGNSETVEQARRALQWALSGLVLILLSYVLVAALGAFLHQRLIAPPSYNDNPNINEINPIGGNGGINNFSDLYLTLISGFFGVMGLLAILFLVINGVRYITARGNEEQAESAKSAITYAALGIVICLLAYVLVRATATFFGAT